MITHSDSPMTTSSWIEPEPKPQTKLQTSASLFVCFCLAVGCVSRRGLWGTGAITASGGRALRCHVRRELISAHHDSSPHPQFKPITSLQAPHTSSSVARRTAADNPDLPSIHNCPKHEKQNANQFQITRKQKLSKIQFPNSSPVEGRFFF